MRFNFSVADWLIRESWPNTRTPPFVSFWFSPVGKKIRLNTLVSIIRYFVEMDKPADILTFLQDFIGELCHLFPLTSSPSSSSYLTLRKRKVSLGNILYKISVILILLSK
jgi:hypothetical protein